LAAVAFPRNPAHVACVKRILPALKHLEIEIFWVGAAGKVDVEITGICGRRICRKTNNRSGRNTPESLREAHQIFLPTKDFPEVEVIR
jgi:hypothetical protein